MDLGIVAQSVTRVGVAAELRAGGERIAVNVRLLLPLLQSSAGAASTELARDLRTAIAGRDAVNLVLPPAASQSTVPARLDVGLRQFAIPATLRDALLAAIGNTVREAAAPALPVAATTAAPAGAATTDAARAWAVAAQTTSAAAIAVSGSGMPRLVQRARDDRPAPSVQFSQPLFEPVGEVQPVQAAAARLRQDVERSGLFFESHVAQWAQGERDTADMRAEALRLLPPSAGGLSDAASQRVAAQVAVLQEAVLALHGPAWPGQNATVVVEREATANGDAAAEPVFCARLALDLPKLGEVFVQLRLSGEAIGAIVTAAQARPFESALPVLAEQLRERGLNPVALHAVAAGDLR